MRPLSTILIAALMATAAPSLARAEQDNAPKASAPKNSGPYVPAAPAKQVQRAGIAPGYTYAPHEGRPYIYRPGVAPPPPVYIEPPVWGWYWGFYPVFAPPPPPQPEYYVEPEPEFRPNPVHLSLGFTGQWNPGGGAFELGAGVEGRRWGLTGSFNGYYEDQGAFDYYGNPVLSEVVDTYDVHLTYALLASRRGRLRLEGGFSGVAASDFAMLGPDVGASAALGLVGPVGVEAGAWLTPAPFRRVQSQVGLTLSLGPFGIRSGYKYMWLDDAGQVDGVRHTATFAGPYLGVGIAL